MRRILFHALSALFFVVPALCAGGLIGQQLPEFGESIVFDKGEPAFKLADLNGKNILLIFFENIG